MMNVLDQSIVSQIPKSTRHQWLKTNQSEMYGFEQISGYANNISSVKEMFEVEFLKKSSIAICKVYRCIHKIMNEVKGYKRAFKKNSEYVVKTIDQLSTLFNLNAACKLFKISIQKFYRLKNK